jgi:hypothetical protein
MLSVSQYKEILIKFLDKHEKQLSFETRNNLSLLYSWIMKYKGIINLTTKDKIIFLKQGVSLLELFINSALKECSNLEQTALECRLHLLKENGKCTANKLKLLKNLGTDLLSLISSIIGCAQSSSDVILTILKQVSNKDYMRDKQKTIDAIIDTCMYIRRKFVDVNYIFSN